jgi:hypothetical protein
MRLPIRSGTSSGVCERRGYSVAGAPSSVLVTGCGDRMLGSSFPAAAGSDFPVFRGPVRTVDGRICSKPWEAATASMDLKYCGG